MGGSPRGYPVHVLLWSSAVSSIPVPGHLQGLTLAAAAGSAQVPVARLRRLDQMNPPAATAPPTARAARVGRAGGTGSRRRRATGRTNSRTGHSRRGRDAAQLAVGVHREGVADHLEHVHVGDGVAVGEALVEVVADGRGEVLDRARLLLGVGVVVDVAGVAAVGDLHPRGDDPVGAEHLADRLDDLGARRRHDDDVATGRAVLLDEGDGLVVDERLDDRGAGSRGRCRAPWRRPSRRRAAT